MGSEPAMHSNMANEASKTASVYLSADLIKRIDHYAQTLRAREAGVSVGRSAAIRQLLLKALPADDGTAK
jgi:hypothetical protein